MSTLYVSDLDGTLLRSNESTSEYTNHVINSLVDKGMIFSYATARSLITAKKVNIKGQTERGIILLPKTSEGKNSIDFISLIESAISINLFENILFNHIIF